MIKCILPFALLLQATSVFAQSTVASGHPSVSFEKWLSVRQTGTVVLSPDGANIAYTVTSTDWKANAYDVEIWLSHQGRSPIQLTNNPKGTSTSPRWSPHVSSGSSSVSSRATTSSMNG